MIYQLNMNRVKPRAMGVWKFGKQYDHKVMRFCEMIYKVDDPEWQHL
jgi:hypothetical protein